MMAAGVHAAVLFVLVLVVLMAVLLSGGAGMLQLMPARTGLNAGGGSQQEEEEQRFHGFILASIFALAQEFCGGQAQGQASGDQP